MPIKFIVERAILQPGAPLIEAITHLELVDSDGTRWRLRTSAAITAIEDGDFEFYLRINHIEVPLAIGTSRGGKRFLKTSADEDLPINLLLIART
ncbi:DUF3892 domain-containing protein [Pseudoroseicyclus aestuarii]|uniref:DUF3892 domain-containing protein n=1 Tax=Pseudoroseicyclus aestuarii TaxID=1795041 RepID=UPI000DA1DAAB